jgi:transposase
MLIIVCDYHPGVQQIAFTDTETGEFGERRLEHGEREAEKFYRDLQQARMDVRVGMEATGHARWFERLLEELHFEWRIGDPLEIWATRVRKQKTDRHDAQQLLKLLLEDRFPRIWVTSWEIEICDNSVASASFGAMRDRSHRIVLGVRHHTPKYLPRGACRLINAL